MHRLPICLLLTLTVLPLTGGPVHATAGPWQENEQSRVRLVSPWETAPREGELRLGLEFEIVPGWHVYWKNSGDAGFPPAIDFSSTPGVRSSELLWPAPERYELRGGLVAFGYEEHVVYPLRVSLAGSPDPSTGDSLPLTADLDYLVCEVDCIPYSYVLTLEQPLAKPGEEPVPGPRAEDLDRWWARLPISLDRQPPELPGVSTRGRLDLEDPESPKLRIELDGLVATDGPSPEPQIFLEAHETFDTGPPAQQPTADGVRFTVPLVFREVPDELPTEADFVWTVTGVRPVNAKAGAALAVEARRTVSALSSEGRAEPETGASGRTAKRSGASWPRAFLAGLLLALTPPLLALLGLRLLVLGELACPGIRRGAGGTVLGLPIGFGLAALAFSGLPTWGAQLQSPLLVTGLALANLALAFFAWRLLVLAKEPRETDPGRPEIAGLAAGIFAAFLALAWNVPGLSFEPLAALAAGLGAAMPYALVVASPRIAQGFHAVGRRLRLREALGFVALPGLLWLLYVLTGSIAPEGVALVELMLLTLGLLAWARTVVSRAWMRWLLTLLLLAAAAYVFVLVDESRRPRFLGKRPSGETEAHLKEMLRA